MPTGSVILENVADWISAGSVAVGVGGNLTAGVKTGDFASIPRLPGSSWKKSKRRVANEHDKVVEIRR
jgi:2-keto-3-deoxy-6-phosphogluconate aldolase